MEKQFKKIKFILIFICCLAIVLSIIWIKHVDKAEDVTVSSSDKKEIAIERKMEKSLIVQDENGEIDKIDAVSGEIQPASFLEKEDFSEFTGFPLLGVDEKSDVEQANVLVSKNQSKAIVEVVAYDSNTSAIGDAAVSQAIMSDIDYLCDVAKKTCQKTDLLTQAYQGLDVILQQNSALFAWDAFDESNNLLFGHSIDKNMNAAAPVYVCDIEKKVCNKTESYDSNKEGGTAQSPHARDGVASQ